MSEPVSESQPALSPSEPIQEIQSTPSEPIQETQSTPSEPIQENQSTPSEPIQETQSSPSELPKEIQTTPAPQETQTTPVPQETQTTPEPTNQTQTTPEPAKDTANKPAPERERRPLKAWPYPSAEDVDLKYEYSPPIITLPRVVAIVAVALVASLWQTDPSFKALVSESLTILNSPAGLFLVTLNLLLIFYFIFRKFYSRNSVYLVDFACFEPPEELRVSNQTYSTMMRRAGFFSEELCDFQEKLLPRTGLGQETSFPRGILAYPPCLNMENARQEFDEVAQGAINDLFAKTGVKPRDIGILIVNCSLFNPTPSMCARIINLYKMRSDIQSYNLSGMGCSASVIAVHLARDLLQTYPNTYALVFSTENITQNWYLGKEKNMLVSNTLFRLGGAAILLSNKQSLAKKAKFELVDTYRAHLGAQDEAFESVYQMEDPEGKKGVRLTQHLMPIAEKALTLNLSYLGTVVLPYDEQLKYVISFLQKRFGFTDKLYQPDFKKGIQHFCIHAGGRAIIDGLEKTLSLEERHVAPSRATLYRYGNTSSSSVWYELRYIERSGSVVAGDIVWQIALGSGFKCNSGVWRALKTIKNRKVQ